MEALGQTLSALPVWAQLLLALLAAVVLVALNAGWLLSTKATLDARKKEQAERARSRQAANRRDPPSP
jgi:Tfp pilus assembly protein PilO